MWYHHGLQDVQLQQIKTVMNFPEQTIQENSRPGLIY